MMATTEVTPTQIQWHEARRARLARMGVRRPQAVVAPRHHQVLVRTSAWVCPEPAPYDHCEPERRINVVRDWKSIVSEIAVSHGVPIHQLTTTGFKPNRVVAARQEAFYRLREEKCLSWSQIGRLMGGFDHTTVLHGWRRHKARMEQV